MYRKEAAPQDAGNVCFFSRIAFVVLCILCAELRAGDLDWIKKEKIRAGYGGAKASVAEMESLFAKMRANGFNAYFAKTDFDVSTKEKWDEFAAKVSAAAKHDIRFFVCVNFLGAGVERTFLAQSKLRYTRPDGPRPKTACPLDEDFWQKAVADRALQAAKMSKDHPNLAGLIVDPEMYSAEATVYPAPCMCDECFKKYLLAALCTAVAPNIPLHEREAYLKKREDGEKEYAILQGAQIGIITKAIRKQLREEFPEFLLGWLLFYPGMNWFGDAAMEQWATEEVPVLLAPENTYFVGYSKGLVDDKVEKLRAAGINALFLPGIGWDPNYALIDPEHLPANLYLCATRADGYWVWHVPYGQPTGAEAELNEKYWAAYRLGNEEIAKWAASGGAHQTSLKLVIAPPNPKADVVARFVKAAGSFAPAQEKAAPVQVPQKPTRLRGLHQAVVLVQPGEGLSAAAAAYNLGDLPGPCGYFVFDAEGKEVKRGDFDVGRSAAIEIADAKPGAYLIALTSRGPTYSLTPRNALASYEAAALHLCQFSRPLWFFVPGGVRQFTIRVEAETRTETALAKVFDPTGRLAAEDTSVDKGAFTLSVEAPPDTDGKAWRLELTKGAVGIFEDIQVRFGPEIPPYVADDPRRLIVPSPK